MTPPVYHYERVGSTMDVIHALAEQGAEAGTVVVAGEQLEGRGSRGRPWHSPPGGLWLSVLFRPPAAEGIEIISLRVGLAVAQCLDRFAPAKVRLKWPNDLILDERKLGGILCEARWQGAVLGWVAAGVGLNVRNQIPDDLRGVAVSLADEVPGICDEELLDGVVAAVRAVDPAAERLTEAELEHFAARNWLKGRKIREPVCGTVANLQRDGAIQVRLSDGSQVSLRNASLELSGASSTR